MIAFLKKHDVGVMGLIMLAAMFLGLIQNPLSILTSTASVTEFNVSGDRAWEVSSAPVVRYLDDIAVMSMFLAITGRLRKLRLWPTIGVGVWLLGLAIAFVHSLLAETASIENVLLVSRQVAFPALLILSGTVLLKGERILLIYATIVLGLANCAYAALELFGVRLFDPAILAVEDGRWVDAATGLPGNFLGWWFDGTLVVRFGGLLINPPTAGLLTAFAAVLAWWTVKRLWLRIPIVGILILVTVGTVSRAGWLLLAAGIVFPLAIRWIGRIASTVIFLCVATAAGIVLSTHGGSGLHANGLIGGFIDGLTNPIGRGFGFAGNFAENAESKESLVGIALSASGWIAIIVIVALGVLLLTDIYRSGGYRWESAVALGVLAAAMFAETAGSIYGTIPLWLFVGTVIASAHIGTRVNSDERLAHQQHPELPTPRV